MPDGYFNAIRTFPNIFTSLFRQLNGLKIISLLRLFMIVILANIYLFKVSNRKTRIRCKICAKLITKTPERRH